MSDLNTLCERKQALTLELHRVQRQIDTHKVKCPTCRCRILPGVECCCCADTFTVEEPAV